MVIVFSPFDKETGKTRKGRKTKHYYSGMMSFQTLTQWHSPTICETHCVCTAGAFDYPKLHEFVFRNALPLVVRLSDNDGPDQEKRNSDSLRVGGCCHAHRFTHNRRNVQRSRSL
jgi:hypothetical protein